MFEGAYQSDKSIGVTLDFLDHLVVIPIKKDEGQEKIQKAGEDSGSTTDKIRTLIAGCLVDVSDQKSDAPEARKNIPIF